MYNINHMPSNKCHEDMFKHASEEAEMEWTGFVALLRLYSSSLGRELNGMCDGLKQEKGDM